MGGRLKYKFLNDILIMITYLPELFPESRMTLKKL